MDEEGARGLGRAAHGPSLKLVGVGVCREAFDLEEGGAYWYVLAVNAQELRAFEEAAAARAGGLIADEHDEVLSARQ